MPIAHAMSAGSSKHFDFKVINCVVPYSILPLFRVFQYALENRLLPLKLQILFPLLLAKFCFELGL